MARKNIELGVIPSGQGGDTFRSAMIKVNDMTEELYQFAENGSGKVDTVAGVPAGAGKDIPKADLVAALEIDKKITIGTVGLDSDTAPPVVDANKVTTGGFHALVPTSQNHAGSDDMSFMHIPHSPDAWSQIAIGQGSGAAMFIRSQNKTLKTPGPWTRFVKVLDYGIGATSNALWQGTEIDPDTFRTQGDYIGQFKIAGFWTMTGYLTVSPGSNTTTCAQTFQVSGISDMYSRTMNGSAWAPWQRMVRPGDYGVGALELSPVPDCNAAKTEGRYRVASNAANLPEPLNGVIEVIPFDQSNVMQRITRFQASGLIREWTRLSSAGEWKQWVLTIGGLQEFITPLTTYTNGQLLGFAHGLGTLPKRLSLVIEPTIDQNGWIAGLRVVPLDGFTIAGGPSDVFVKVAATGFRITDTASGNPIACNPANWRMRVFVSS